MTPVDSCAQAILELANVKDSKQLIYHVFNTNMLLLGEVISILRQVNYKIRIMSDRKFMQEINHHSKKESYSILLGLMEDITSQHENEKISITAELTKLLLSRSGFNWPVIDADYMEGFLNCLDVAVLKER
jgi:hypothetical protein